MFKMDLYHFVVQLICEEMPICILHCITFYRNNNVKLIIKLKKHQIYTNGSTFKGNSTCNLIFLAPRVTSKSMPIN